LFWISACEYAGSRDFAFVGAVEISNLRLQLQLRLLCSGALVEQITEYQKLKEKAARDSGNYLTEVNSFEIQLKSDNAQLENERRQRDDLLSQIKVVEQQRDFRLQRIKKLNDYIRFVLRLLHGFYLFIYLFSHLLSATYKLISSPLCA